jgi:group I intron endonuclease
MEEKFGTIYIPTNLINGKQYVGQTTTKLNKRINSHKNNKSNYPFTNAIKKYGIENFKIISFSCPEEDLDWIEEFLIKELNTLLPNGYNLDSGGNKNKHLAESTKEKIRINHLGKHASRETKNKMSISRIGDKNPRFGKPHSETSLQKMRDKKKGKNNPMYGTHKQHTEITKNIISKKAKKRYENKENHPRSRAVILISPEGKKYELACYHPFCKEHNLSGGNICKVLQGKLKQHKGWQGKYLKNNK